MKLDQERAIELARHIAAQAVADLQAAQSEGQGSSHFVPSEYELNTKPYVKRAALHLREAIAELEKVYTE
jgi:hypothetical protein